MPSPVLDTLRVRAWRTLLLLLLVSCAFPVQARQAKKRVAVMPVTLSASITTRSGPTRSGDREETTSFDIPPPEDFARGLTEMLTTALVSTDRFVVLERVAMGDLLDEQERAEAGQIAEGTEAQGGQVLGAQVLVRAAITGYTYNRSESGGRGRLLKGIRALEGVGVSRTVEKAAVVIDVRLYDAETGQILASEYAEGEAKGSDVSVDLQREAGEASVSGFRQTPLGQASRDAIETAVAFITEEMDALPWEGRVAAIDTLPDGVVDVVYVNAGSNQGLTVGQQVDVYRPGRPITDPETQVVIGRTRDRAVGRCEIIEVLPTLSIAAPITGDTIREGDVVRLVVQE